MILLILALLCLIFLALATTGVPAHPRLAWLPAGLFCWALVTFWPLLNK